MQTNNRKQLTKFCILSTQRSGSTWLRTLLGSHPKIKTFDEIFLPDEPDRKWQKDLIPFFRFQHTHSYNRPWMTFHYLDTLDGYSGEHEAIGFKLMYDQIRKQPEILFKIILDQFKIIHLVRENYLDIVISQENAKTVMHTKVEVELPPVYLEPSDLLKKLSSLEFGWKRYDLLFKFLPNQVMRITYKDLCSTTDELVNRIASFLDIPSSEVNYQSSLKKINRGKYQHKIENYKEIESILSGTKFEKFLI